MSVQWFEWSTQEAQRMSPVCEKSKSSNADLLHSYALCSRIQEHCNQIFSLFLKVLKIQTIPDPILTILRVEVNTRLPSSNNACPMAYLMQRNSYWCSGKRTPSLRQWQLNDTLERIRFVLKDKLKECLKIWFCIWKGRTAQLRLSDLKL